MSATRETCAAQGVDLGLEDGSGMGRKLASLEAQIVRV